jgi:hypothetical protein
MYLPRTEATIGSHLPLFVDIRRDRYLGHGVSDWFVCCVRQSKVRPITNQALPRPLDALVPNLEFVLGLFFVLSPTSFLLFIFVNYPLVFGTLSFLRPLEKFVPFVAEGVASSLEELKNQYQRLGVSSCPGSY